MDEPIYPDGILPLHMHPEYNNNYERPPAWYRSLLKAARWYERDDYYEVCYMEETHGGEKKLEKGYLVALHDEDAVAVWELDHERFTTNGGHVIQLVSVSGGRDSLVIFGHPVAATATATATDADIPEWYSQMKKHRALDTAYCVKYLHVMKTHSGYCSGEDDFSEDNYGAGRYIEKRIKRGYLDEGTWDFDVKEFHVAPDCEERNGGTGYCDVMDSIILLSCMQC